MTTQPYIQQQKQELTPRSIDITVNPNDKGGRIPYGSKREFHLKFLSDNWRMTNQEIGSILGVTSGSISRLRKIVRERPQLFEIAFNDYMELRNKDTIPDNVKFQGAIKLLVMLLEKSNVSIEDKKEIRLSFVGFTDKAVVKGKE